jgi:hypothetical protein
MNISVVVYNGAGNTVLEDLTDHIANGGGVRWSLGPRGFGTLELPNVPTALMNAFRRYNYPQLPRVVACDDSGDVVFEGRLERRRIDTAGNAFTATGFWRAFYDVPVTAVYSTADHALWRPYTAGYGSGAFTTETVERCKYENDGKALVVAPYAGSYGSGADFGFILGAFWNARHDWKRLIFDWSARMNAWNVGAFSGYIDGAISFSASSFNQSTSSGSTRDYGTEDVDISRSRAEIAWLRTYPGGALTASEGFYFFECRRVRALGVEIKIADTTTTAGVTSGTVNVTPASMAGIYEGAVVTISDGVNTETERVLSTTSTTFEVELANAYSSGATVEVYGVRASDMAEDLLSFVRDVNASQLVATTSQIEQTTTDWQNAIWEDTFPGQILDELCARENYEWGVGAGRQLYFRPAGSRGRTFFVDVTDFSLEQDLNEKRNAAYAVYKRVDRQIVRTDVAESAADTSRDGIERRAAIDVDTVLEADAVAVRDAFLDSRARYSLRATLQFDSLYNESGAQARLTELRHNDTLVVRNLPASPDADIDQLTTFKIRHIVIDATGNALTVRIEPDATVPTLVTLISGE